MEQTKETIDELRQKIGALETERKQAEQTALEVKRSLTRLIESSPDAIISTDKQGNVVLFSEGAETLLGYRAKEVTSRNISVLYGDEAEPKQIAREMRKRGGSVSCFESVLLAKDGSNIPVLISASVLSDDKGEETGTIGFVRDSISDKIRGASSGWRRETQNPGSSIISHGENPITSSRFSLTDVHA